MSLNVRFKLIMNGTTMAGQATLGSLALTDCPIIASASIINIGGGSGSINVRACGGGALTLDEIPPVEWDRIRQHSRDGCR